MILEIELYVENDKFCAYIGSENSSGYVISEDTKEACAKSIGEYIAQYENWK